MTDSDAVIGRLYTALLEREEEKNRLISIIHGLKRGEIALDRIGITPNGITLVPELEAVPLEESS